MSPQDGVWVRGLYLEGAGWDQKNSCLVEAEPMQLVCLMPTIHFRPTESRKKSAKGETTPSDLPAPSLVWLLTHLLLHSSPIPAAALFSQRLQGPDSYFSLPSGMYSCPCYYYPNRAGSSDRVSFVIGIDLRCGTMTSDHWIKRGTALLMSLDN